MQWTSGSPIMATLIVSRVQENGRKGSVEELKTKALSIMDTVILVTVKICSNEFTRFLNAWIKKKKIVKATEI